MDYSIQHITYKINESELRELKELQQKGYFSRDFKLGLEAASLDDMDYEEYEEKSIELIKVFTSIFPLKYIISAHTDFGGELIDLYFNSSEFLIRQLKEFQVLPDIDVNLLYVNLENLQKEKKFGKPLIDGHFVEEFSNEQIKIQKKGLTHEVILLNDNRIIKRGSNANGQLSFNNEKRIKNIVCGRFYTAFLKEDGTVKLYGHCQDQDERILKGHEQNELTYKPSEYVYKEAQTIVELIFETDENKITNLAKLVDSDGVEVAQIFDAEEDGEIYLDLFAANILNQYIAYSCVTESPYNRLVDSTNRKLLDLYLNYDFEIIHPSDWKDIIEIHSNYDGIIGKDKEGNMFAYGAMI